MYKIERREDVEPMRRRLEEGISGPFHFEENEIDLRASIGAAVFPDDGAELETLIEKSDQAMYEIKRSRKRRASGRGR